MTITAAPGLGEVTALLEAMPTLTPWHVESIGHQLVNRNLYLVSTAASAAYPSASRALFYPFRLAKRTSFDKWFAYNGASASNSVDLGVYLSDGGYVRSIGLQGRTGTSTLNIFSDTAFAFGPGDFYLAISQNGTTGSYFSVAPAVGFLRGWGASEQDLSGVGTPGTLPVGGATFAAITQAYVPIFGLIREGFTV